MAGRNKNFKDHTITQEEIIELLIKRGDYVPQDIHRVTYQDSLIGDLKVKVFGFKEKNNGTK